MSLSRSTHDGQRVETSRRKGYRRAVLEACQLTVLALLVGPLLQWQFASPLVVPQYTSVARYEGPELAPQDELMPTGHDASFGTVHTGKRIIVPVEYVNPGDRPQALRFVSNSGRVKVSAVDESLLAPGQRARLILELDRRVTHGDVDESVDLFAQGVLEPVATYRLRGSFKHLVEVQPPDQLDFGVFAKGTPIWRNLLVAELERGAIGNFSLTAEPPSLLAKDCAVIVREDGTRVFDCRVGIPPEVNRGPLTGRLTLTFDPARFDPIVVWITGSVE